MNIQEKAKKFVAGKIFSVQTSTGGLEWVEVDERGCNRWICEGTTVAVRQPDGTITYPGVSFHPDSVDRRIKACQDAQQSKNQLDAIETFAVWSNNCTFEGFQRLYKAFGFSEESIGYIKEKWRVFGDNPLQWYLDLDRKNRALCFQINIKHETNLPE